MKHLQSLRFRSIKAVAPNPQIIAGYSIEMLDAGISQLAARGEPTAWEAAQLAALRHERAQRCAAPQTHSTPATAA